MSPRRIYLTYLRRVEDYWSLSVYGLAEARTQVPTLHGAEEIARDLVALVLNVPVDSFDIDLRVIHNSRQAEYY
jgi:hypothetical protein